MNVTDNYKKHTSNNPVQRLLLDNFFKTLVNVAQPLTINSILDAGCGEGFTLDILQKHRIGKRLEGLEFSESAIALGKKHHPSLIFKQGSIYELPYKDNIFDLVVCTEVLEHLEDPQKALRELVRVSRRYLVLSVPNEPIFMLANFIRGKNWSRWGNDIEHIQHWSFLGFEHFVKKDNIQILQKRYPFPWTMLLAEKRS